VPLLGVWRVVLTLKKKKVVEYVLGYGNCIFRHGNEVDDLW
jgi:hypothetical protein